MMMHADDDYDDDDNEGDDDGDDDGDDVGADDGEQKFDVTMCQLTYIAYNLKDKICYRRPLVPFHIYLQ